MRYIDSEALRAFLAVVDHGSFTAAASHLSKTQAAVSLTIARLEDGLGKRLFDRSSRQVTLTTAGQRLLGYARQIKKLESEALQTVTGRAAEGLVRLGMPDDYIGFFGEALIKRFGPASRNIQIDLQCRFTGTLRQMIDNRELDLAVITQDPDNPSGTFLRHERQFWCTGPNANPENEPCLQLALFSEECPARSTVLGLLEKSGRPWTIAYQASHLAGVQLATASGKLLTVLPEPAIPTNWRRLGPAEGLPELPPNALALIINKNDRLPARQVAAFLQREFGSGDEPQSRENPVSAVG